MSKKKGISVKVFDSFYKIAVVYTSDIIIDDIVARLGIPRSKNDKLTAEQFDNFFDAILKLELPKDFAYQAGAWAVSPEQLKNQFTLLQFVTIEGFFYLSNLEFKNLNTIDSIVFRSVQNNHAILDCTFRKSRHQKLILDNWLGYAEAIPKIYKYGKGSASFKHIKDQTYELHISWLQERTQNTSEKIINRCKVILREGQYILFGLIAFSTFVVICLIHISPDQYAYFLSYLYEMAALSILFCILNYYSVQSYKNLTEQLRLDERQKMHQMSVKYHQDISKVITSNEEAPYLKKMMSINSHIIDLFLANSRSNDSILRGLNYLFKTDLIAIFGLNLEDKLEIQLSASNKTETLTVLKSEKSWIDLILNALKKSNRTTYSLKSGDVSILIPDIGVHLNKLGLKALHVILIKGSQEFDFRLIIFGSSDGKSSLDNLSEVEQISLESVLQPLRLLRNQVS